MIWGFGFARAASCGVAVKVITTEAPGLIVWPAKFQVSLSPAGFVTTVGSAVVAPVIEVDPARIEKRLSTKYLDESTSDVDEAIETARRYAMDGVAR